MSKISEEKFDSMIENNNIEELFANVIFVNIPDKNIKEDALSVLADFPYDLDDNENIIMPIRCEYVSYSQEATGFRIILEDDSEHIFPM